MRYSDETYDKMLDAAAAVCKEAESWLQKCNKYALAQQPKSDTWYLAIARAALATEATILAARTYADLQREANNARADG